MGKKALWVLVASGALMAGGAFSEARAADIVVNGGFEGGVYSSTLAGTTPPYLGPYTNLSVPDGWSATVGYDYEPSFNLVTHFATHVYSGSSALSLGNYDVSPYVATLTQTFADVSGQSYLVTFYAFDGGGFNSDPNAFLKANVGLANIFLTAASPGVGSYAPYAFSFTGTGSDTLVIAAQTNPSEWYIDNVSVTGPAVGAVPEPETYALMLGGLGLLGVVARSRKAAQQ